MESGVEKPLHVGLATESGLDCAPQAIVCTYRHWSTLPFQLRFSQGLCQVIVIVGQLVMLSLVLSNLHTVPHHVL